MRCFQNTRIISISRLIFFKHRTIWWKFERIAEIQLPNGNLIIFNHTDILEILIGSYHKNTYMFFTWVNFEKWKVVQTLSCDLISTNNLDKAMQFGFGYQAFFMRKWWGRVAFFTLVSPPTTDESDEFLFLSYWFDNKKRPWGTLKWDDGDPWN